MKDTLVLRLELISAKAALLADAVENGSLWEGDLGKGLNELQAEIKKAVDQSE